MVKPPPAGPDGRAREAGAQGPREKRLAEALRANLRRRKLAARPAQPGVREKED